MEPNRKFTGGLLDTWNQTGYLQVVNRKYGTNQEVYSCSLEDTWNQTGGLQVVDGIHRTKQEVYRSFKGYIEPNRTSTVSL